MGSFLVSERVFTNSVPIIDEILPFLGDEDAVSLSESVLAPKPKPSPKPRVYTPGPAVVVRNGVPFYLREV